jgi:MFS family permease
MAFITCRMTTRSCSFRLEGICGTKAGPKERRSRPIFSVTPTGNTVNPAEVTGNLLAMIGLPLTLLVFPAGLLSDRLGRRRLNLLAGAVIAPAIFLLIFARSVTTLLIFGGIIGAGVGIFLSANWALATDLIPQEEAGKYLGLANLATAGSGAVGRLAGPLIDGVNALRPGAYLGYPALFILASLSVLVGTLLVLRIHEPMQARFES